MHDFTVRGGPIFAVALLATVVCFAPAFGQDGPVKLKAALPQMVGFDVPVPHVESLPRARGQLDRVVETGANAVRFLVPLYQPHARSKESRLDQRPGRGPTDADLLSLIEHARKLGLHAVVCPRLAFTRPQRSQRLADLEPQHWETWWVSYAEGVTHYARLSARAGVDVFGLADGLDTALDPRKHPGALNRWDALIADVRDNFTGPVVIWAGSSRSIVTADALDLDWIGIRPILNFDQRELSSDRRRGDAMQRQWKALLLEAMDAAEKQRRPLAIAAVGLPSRPDGWNPPPYRPFAPSFVDDGVASQSAVQSSALRGFLQAWRDEVPAPPGSGDPARAAAVFFADWRLDREGGPFDPSYAMQGKPAEAILRRYFSGDHE
ncbi:MAG: hypothetical protein AAF916_05685 [Planctomycetota bacterium]